MHSAKEFSGITVCCPNCSVALHVGILPRAQKIEQGEGWWFECTQCKHRWWYSALSDSNDENREKNVEELRKIMAEFNDLQYDMPRQNFAYSEPSLASSDLNVLDDSKISDDATGKDTPTVEITENQLRLAPINAVLPVSDNHESTLHNGDVDELQKKSTKEKDHESFDYQLALILRDPRNLEVLDGKFGENFFPKKPQIDTIAYAKRGRPPHLTASTKVKRIDGRSIDADSHKTSFMGSRAQAPNCTERTVQSEHRNEEPTSFLRLGTIEEKETTPNYSYKRVLPKRSSPNEQQNKTPNGDNYVNEASLKNQSKIKKNHQVHGLCTSLPSFVTPNKMEYSPSENRAIVFTNVDSKFVETGSFYPIEKNQKFVEDEYVAKRRSRRFKFLMEIPNRGEKMHKDQGFHDFHNKGVSDESHDDGGTPAGLLDKPGYVKDPESVSERVLTLWASGSASTNKTTYNSKERWRLFKRKPLLKQKRKNDMVPLNESVDDTKLELVIDNKLVAQEQICDLNKSIEMHKPHEKQMPEDSANTSCFAISEGGKAPVIIPFSKEPSKSKILPPILPDYKETDYPAIKIPVITEEKDELRKLNFGSGLKWFISFVGAATIAAVYFSYQHKNEVLNLWKSPVDKNVGIAADQLSLERVSYSFAKDGASSKITIVGEIVNNKDSTLEVSPLRVKIFSTKTPKLLTTWDYSPNLSAVLPNEHSFFKIERPLQLDPSQEIQVEVSFTQSRQHSRS
ncbi:MAG: hypothetical protein LBJ89_00190 [Holosporales bacterium]|jgi:hypothetical protein|nr:hypothetical protein [Holosporales bacterium]